MTLPEWLAMTESERRQWAEQRESAPQRHHDRRRREWLAMAEAERRKHARPPFGSYNPVET